MLKGLFDELLASFELIRELLHGQWFLFLPQMVDDLLAQLFLLTLAFFFRIIVRA